MTFLIKLLDGKSSRDVFYELLKDWEKDEDKRQGLAQREKMKYKAYLRIQAVIVSTTGH